MNIIFVCHGNICRSVAAEYIAKDLDKEGRHNFISRATSLEEIGNDIYPPMKNELARQKIPFSHHSATRINQYDYDWADIIYYMDDENKYSLKYMFDDELGKIKPIYQYSKGIYEIEDPWYTRNFQSVVNQIKICITDILDNLK